jgi:predicted dinucleotide-binding enzyme
VTNDEVMDAERRRDRFSGGRSEARAWFQDARLQRAHRQQDTGEAGRFHEGDRIPAGTFAEAARDADIIVLAVHGASAESALHLAEAVNLAGKIIIDTTNPISDKPPVDGVLQCFTGPNSSLMEILQAAFPQARFVKAFNSVGNAKMVNPVYERGRPSMFYCGNDADAKSTVATILEQFVGNRSTWEKPPARGRSSRSVSSGASPDFCRTGGRTRLPYLVLIRVTLALLLSLAASGRDGAARGHACLRCAARRRATRSRTVEPWEPLRPDNAAGWIVRLVPAAEGCAPADHGARSESEDLARLRRPGISFRTPARSTAGTSNADNTGAERRQCERAAELREFIFRRLSAGSSSYNAAHPAGSGRTGPIVRRGWIYIESYRLTPPRRGERASFETLTLGVPDVARRVTPEETCVRAGGTTCIASLSSPRGALVLHAGRDVFTTTRPEPCRGVSHADDEDPASAAFARYAREGVQVFFLIASDGGQAPALPPRARHRPSGLIWCVSAPRGALRGAGARRTATNHLDFPDGNGAIDIGDRTLAYPIDRAHCRELQRLRPDAIVTWGPKEAWPSGPSHGE